MFREFWAGPWDGKFYPIDPLIEEIAIPAFDACPFPLNNSWCMYHEYAWDGDRYVYRGLFVYDGKIERRIA